MAAKAFVLGWDLHHRDDEFDAELVKFRGCKDSVRLASPSYVPPAQVRFEANFKALARSDFPYNDVHWPVMSARMIDVLTAIESFEFRRVPIVMIDDTITFDRKRKIVKSTARNDDYSAIQLLQQLDVFDWDRSKAERIERLPHRVRYVDKLVLREPKTGYPPLFRIRAYPIALFVSAAAKAKLERANIRGVEYGELAKFRG